MASDYPGGIDSFDTIASDKKTSDSVGGRTHRAMHNDLGDAIEAVQTELGTDPSGTYSTVKARFEAIEGSTLPQVDAKGDLIVGTADNTYDNLTAGSNDTVLVADSAQAKGVKWAQVPTAAIQDGAVTAAKLATTGRFLFPTGAANGYGFTGGAVHLEGGSSSPEGVVTANPGSTFLQTSGAATVTGMLSWRKATGTGNTGWVAEGALADTGLRNIASLLANSWDTTVADGQATLRRVGSTVTLRLFVKNGTAAGVLTNPAGFRPTASLYEACTLYSGVLVGSVYVAPSGQVEAYSAGGGAPALAGGFYVTVTFDTAGAWPSSLPGSAA